MTELVREQETNGLHTTADETAEAIETWFRFLGAVLLAEYLSAGAPSGRLNRWLFGLLSMDRPMRAGIWVAVGRACRQELTALWNDEFQPLWPALGEVSLGDPGDEGHPVSRLIRYRNHFGHGGFAQDQYEILVHGHLLEGQVALLRADLELRPIRRVSADGAVAVLQGASPGEFAHTLQGETAPPAVPAGAAYVAMPDGEARVLAPALDVSLSTNGRWQLSHQAMASRKKPLPPEVLERFADNLQRYRHEQAGHLRFEPHEAPERPEPLAREVEGLSAALESGEPLTLVEYRPGAGQGRLAAGVWSEVSQHCDRAFLWRCIRDEHDTHPAVRGSVLARALLRHAESTLGLGDGELDPADGDLFAALEDAGRRLSSAGRRVCFVLMDAAKGLEAGATDGVAVVEVCKALSGGFRAVLLATPSSVQSLPHDGPILGAPLPGADEFERQEFDAALGDWLAGHPEVRLATLQEVTSPAPAWAGAADPLDAAVTAVESRLGRPVFAPAVEHALWTAAPFLETATAAGAGTPCWSWPGGADGVHARAAADFLRRAPEQRGERP